MPLLRRDDDFPRIPVQPSAPPGKGGVAYDKATSGMSESAIAQIDKWDDKNKVKLTLPQATLDAMDRTRDCGGAIIFGSVGRPDLPKRVAELALLAMRKRFGVVNDSL